MIHNKKGAPERPNVIPSKRPAYNGSLPSSMAFMISS
jgi:hypothetical protein